MPETAHNSRIPGLDGWRGVAILLVLIDHLQSSIHGGYLERWTQTGMQGVTVFFVLSGFLITSKLIEDGNLRRFYLRRFFRLMPVAWVYLAFLYLFSLRFSHVLSVREALSCLFFYRNYLGDTHSAVAAHFWSLSLEEQFYLIWPLLLLLAGIRKARWIAFAGAMACAAYRFMFWGRYDSIWYSRHTEVHADALLVGCAMALLLANEQFREQFKRWCNPLALPLLLVFFVCIFRFHWLQPLYENAALALLISITAISPQSPVSRLMSWRPLTYLGIISYSVYVWQEFFMLLPGRVGFAVMLFGVPLFSLGSYYYIERPFIKIGYRVADWLVAPQNRKPSPLNLQSLHQSQSQSVPQSGSHPSPEW